MRASIASRQPYVVPRNQPRRHRPTHARAAPRPKPLAVALRGHTKHNLSLRELYRSLELPGDHPLKAAHVTLDDAVRTAYGMTAAEDPLAYLLSLNAQFATAEANGDPVQGPGLPSFVKDREAYVTEDCIKP